MEKNKASEEILNLVESGEAKPMNKRREPETEEFKILEERGYDLEQFLCRCPGKTSFEQVHGLLRYKSEKDPIAVLTVTLIDPDKLTPILTKSITTNLDYIIKGLKNLDELKGLLPDDPIAALYVILTNNLDSHKTAREVEKFCAGEHLNLGP